MSRIDPSRSSPLSIDTTPETPPAPATPSAKPRSAPATHNEVRAYEGPPRQATGAPVPAPPESAGPAMSAGELAVLLGGRPRQSSTEVSAEVYADIRANLTRSLGNLLIDGENVKAVHTALGSLQPGAYRAALERMQQDGLLRTYVEVQDTGTRRAFLEQAESKGMLQRLQGTPPEGPLGYPGRPDFFHNTDTLPESMRDAVSQHAIEAGRGYFIDYAEYLGRYREAVGTAPNLEALAALGEPKEAGLAAKHLKLSGRDPKAVEYERAWKESVKPLERTRVAAYKDVAARKAELAGELAGGSIELKAKSELGYGAMKLGREATLDTRGKTGIKTELGVSAEAGPVGIEVSRDSGGKAESEVKLDLGFLELSESSDGEQKVAVKVGKFFEVSSEYNPRTAKFGGSVSTNIELGDFELGGETGFSMKGTPRGQAGEAIDKNNPGVFGRPDELEARTAWDALPASRRALHEKNGWTRERWTRELAR